MKRILPIICLAFFFAGCGSTRKVTTSRHGTGRYTETTTETKTGDSSLFIDTTKVSDKEIIYTKVEFYPPELTKKPGRAKWNTLDSISHVAARKAWEDVQTWRNRLPAYNGPVKHPPNVGPVKSIETLTVKDRDEERGITESHSDTDEARKTDITDERTVTDTITEKPAADPYRWRYILGILLAVIAIGAATYFWFRKAGVFVKLAALFKRLFL